MRIDPMVTRSIGYLVKVVAQGKVNKTAGWFLYFSQNRGFPSLGIGSGKERATFTIPHS